jgi:hypothetical protein
MESSRESVFDRINVGCETQRHKGGWKKLQLLVDVTLWACTALTGSQKPLSSYSYSDPSAKEFRHGDIWITPYQSNHGEFLPNYRRQV